MIIDCHVHVNNYHDEEVESLNGSLEELQLAMRRNRIDVALILTSYKVSAGRPPIRDVVKAIHGSKKLYAVAGISWINFKPSQLDELREYLQDGSVRGFKLYPGYEPFYPADEKLRPMYEMAEEFAIPVMVHTGDTYDPRGKLKFAHPLNVDEVAVDYPKVNFVICHLGNPWLTDTMEVVYKNENVYADVSGLVLGNFSDRFESFMHRRLQEICMFGVEPEKLLFGTDWPISTMESYLRFMEDMKMPERDKKKILYQNSAQLFKIPVGDQSHATLNGLKNLLR